MRGPTSEDVQRLRTWLLDDHRRTYEEAIVGLVWSGALLTVLGALAAIVATFWARLPLVVFQAGIWVAGSGVVATGLSVLGGLPLAQLRRYKAAERSGSRYERRRNWTRLKSSSVLLNILTFLASIGLGVALLRGLGADPIQVPGSISVVRVTLMIVGAMGVNLAYSHRVSLDVERRDRPVGPTASFFLFAGIGAFVFAALAFVTGAGGASLPLLGRIEVGESVLFVLAGLTSAAVALFLVRDLPTVTALYLEEGEYRRDGYASQQKSVILPTMIAFALLFLVLLLVFIFELSILESFAEFSQNMLVLGIMGFMVLALAASVAISVALARGEEETELYRQRRTSEEQTEITVLAVSGLLGLVFLGIAVSIAMGYGLAGITVPESRWIDAVALGVLGALGPYGFYYARESKRVRNLEERFPDLLRDLAAGRRAGLTLSNAVKVSAEGDYGALTADVEKMADQLTWNVSFEEALDRFGQRVDTPLARRACSLINEASRSGGQVIDVLEAAAVDAREIKTLENERRLTMTLYTAVIYIAFLVFLGVAAILQGTFIPEVLATTQGIPSGGGAAGGGLSGLGTSGLDIKQFRTFFYVGSIAQGVGNGMMAGMMESGKPLNGLRHAFVMTLVTFFVFTFFLG